MRTATPIYACALAAALLLAAGASLAQDVPSGRPPPKPAGPMHYPCCRPHPRRTRRSADRASTSERDSPDRAGISRYRDRPARRSSSGARIPPPPPKQLAEAARQARRRRCSTTATMLAELYAHLAKAPDAEQAAPIAKTIEGLWLHSGSDTIGLLMGRSSKAVNEQHNDLALQAARCRRRAGARLCRGLEPARLRLLSAERLRARRRRSAPRAGARAQPLQGARRARPHPARERAEEERAARPTSSSCASIPTCPAPRRPPTSCPSRSRAKGI